MKNNKKTEFKVGLTALAALVILIWVIGWAKNIGVFSDEKVLKIQFDSVPGLEVGSEVSINGVGKGYVDKIELTKSHVLVTSVLESDTKIYRGAEFSIMMKDLMGGKVIEIKNPPNSTQLIDFNEIQNGKFAGDIATAMAALSYVEGDLIDVIKEVKITLNSMNKYLTDDELRVNLKNSLAQVEEMTVNLNSLIQDNRNGIKSLIESGNELSQNANRLLLDNEETLKTTLIDAGNLIRNTDDLINRLNSFSDEIKNKENNIGKAIYDEEFLNELRSSLDQVKELTKLLVEQLQKEGIKVDAYIF